MGLAATGGWLVGGAVVVLATRIDLPVELFTVPFALWIAVGGFTLVIWGGLWMFRRG